MKRIIRFELDQKIHWGELDQSRNQVYFVSGSIYQDWSRGKLVGDLNSVKLHPPCEPRIIVGLAYNYKDLVGVKDTYEEPLIFLKTPNAVVSSVCPIKVPKQGEKTWVEVELAVVLKRSIFNATYEEASKAILGVTVANDVTTQNLYSRDHHLARSKSLPGFCPVGDFLTTGVDTSNLKMTTVINGKVTQNSSTNERILNEVEALVLISKFIPLTEGDLVLTGTPAGAMESLVYPGDRVELKIENLGTLINKVEKAE